MTVTTNNAKPANPFFPEETRELCRALRAESHRLRLAAGALVNRSRELREETSQWHEAWQTAVRGEHPVR